MFSPQGGALRDILPETSCGDREHAAGCGSPRLTTSTTPPPVSVCVCLSVCFYLISVRVDITMFLCSSCMHLPPPSMCVCVCVYVYVPSRKSFTVRILDREEYNKLSSFYILLDTPQWRRNGKEHTGVTSQSPLRNALNEVFCFLVNPESTDQLKFFLLSIPEWQRRYQFHPNYKIM